MKLISLAEDLSLYKNKHSYRMDVNMVSSGTPGSPLTIAGGVTSGAYLPQYTRLVGRMAVLIRYGRRGDIIGGSK